MPTVEFVSDGGTVTAVTAAPGTTAMRAATGAGVQGIVGECGGQMMCSTCHVYVQPDRLEELPEMEPDEDEMLDLTAAPRRPESRLSCQIVLDEQLDGLRLTMPSHQV
ncbi:2Fe-2S iron-sulfur cluster binding domain-containing protein [Nakamurella sp. YIM 132087]|uniref:2Fe-2S iron-sulfur cluster binding domain-containing protein n=1 Tax=Nakamurella alba TaxID=2665158 RepID=A0A7K1FH45_9ACTN|nr:2Fe-2S iron-sulfur cluster binding domain-containing protein [Nakamurella alba]